MKPTKLLFFSSLLLYSLFSSQAGAQQNYSGTAAFDCGQHDRTGWPSPAFLYTCSNGVGRPNCATFLLFVSRRPFDSVSSISALTSSDPRELARINRVAEVEDFPANREVIVPLNCSCSDQYYEKNTTFHVTRGQGTYFSVANEAFQGLTTCNALKRANPQNEQDLFDGMELQVPLRCACPTSDQSGNGTKYLLTYPIAVGDTLFNLSVRFNASLTDVLEANGLEENQVIHPSTTVLIPLSMPPSSSQTIIRKVDEAEVVAHPRLPLLQGHGKSRSRKKIYEVVGVAAACLILVVAVSVSAALLFCRRREGVVVDPRPCKNKKTKVLDNLRMEIASLEHGMRVFSFKELKQATGDFSPKSRVSGSVYRGNIHGEVLAIKRTRMDVREEVKLLKKLNHFNLIKLLGVCENRGWFFLAFEYMKTGSLNEWLQDCNAREIRNWSRRVQIALDVANGLHYLHSFTKPPYVHGDISSSNVLLSSALRAKIGDFSQARAASSGQETDHIFGTIGYMAPEYIESGQVTTQVDVYAFGIVLLELITGKGAVIARDGEKVLLTTLVAESELGSIIDHRLEFYGDAKVMLRIARACLTREQSWRPSMEEVVTLLSKLQADLFRTESASVGIVSCERK